MLKLGVPGPDVSCEIQALEAYAGGAAVRVLDSDRDRGIMLLECVEPVQTLASLADDEQATRVAAAMMRELWRPLPSEAPFPAVSHWADGLTELRKRFDGGTGPFPAALIDQAESLFRELLSSAEPFVLLHGDLHPFNILSARCQPWLAIDPKGLAGEPAYEVGALLRNPGPRLCTDPKVQRRRIEVLNDQLGFARDRMLGWGMAQAVLAAWWSFEDSGTDWKCLCACAEVLAQLRTESNK